MGFAVGFDRLAELLADGNEAHVRNPDVFIAALGEKSQAMAFGWTCELALTGILTEMDYEGRSLKSQMKRANRAKAAHVLILGENEISQGAAVFRNMSTKVQEDLPLEDVIRIIKEKMGKE